MIESFDAASAIMVTRATGYSFNTPNRILSVQINCLRRLLKLLPHAKFAAKPFKCAMNASWYRDNMVGA